MTPPRTPHVEQFSNVPGGRGELWREYASGEDTVRVSAEKSQTIPPRTPFSSATRTSGAGPLRSLIVTMPPWPSPQEAEKAAGVSLGMATASAEPTRHEEGGHDRP